MNFEWDQTKAANNIKKHGVSFEDAASVFGDSLAITFRDPDHSREERRMLTFGLCHSGKLLVVSRVERSN